MKIKKNGVVMNLTDSDIKKLEKSILNEQLILLGYAAAIMLYRQSAKAQAKKLTRKIKRNLKFNKSIVKKGETGDLGYDKFKKDFKSRIGVCCNHFKIASECDTIYKGVLSTINDFRDKKFRL